jgi:endonuclease/exonuclease/phosphatase family metal-dependent hydrolase
MRVATVNVWNTGEDWARRRAVLAAGFATMAPDLVTLQETIVTDGYDQAREIVGAGYELVHQKAREPDGQGVSIASRWPVGEVIELDQRTSDAFAATSLIVEILAPDGRVWLVNHFPDYQLDHAAQRERQAVVTARAVEELLAERPAHVIVAGDLDADPAATSIRFWTGRHALEGFSVCYRDAWESAHPGEPGHTFTPDNRYSANPDWPFRRIDYVLVRCGDSGGPSLLIDSCDRIFAGPDSTASDHYGLLAHLHSPS